MTGISPRGGLTRSSRDVGRRVSTACAALGRHRLTLRSRINLVTGPKNTSAGQTSAAGSTPEPSDNTTMWVALGAAGAVLVIGGGAFAVIRSRRKT
jgi:hypothetical protein